MHAPTTKYQYEITFNTENINVGNGKDVDIFVVLKCFHLGFKRNTNNNLLENRNIQEYYRQEKAANLPTFERNENYKGNTKLLMFPCFVDVILLLDSMFTLNSGLSFDLPAKRQATALI